MVDIRITSTQNTLVYLSARTWWYQKYQVFDYLSVLYLSVQKDHKNQEDDHLGVLVCEDVVVPGVGADQAAKISKTFCLKSAL